MIIDLSGKVAVVTGAARGIGAALAGRLADEGAIVSRWDNKWPQPPELGDAQIMQVDVTDTASIDAAVKQVVEQYGRIDILINNAGITMEEPVEDMPEEHWLKIIDVNLNGIFRVSKAVIPTMKQQKSGRIINSASFAAIVPAYGGAAYASSKSGVVYFTRVLAGELGPWGITVNAYAPGMVPTDINHYTERPAQEQKDLLNTLTLHRWESAEDVADLICFLASDKAGYITGTLIDVSGGKLATQRPYVAYDLAAEASK